METTELTQAPHVDHWAVGELLGELFESDIGEVFSETLGDANRESLLFGILNDGDRGESYDKSSLWCSRERDATHWSLLDYWSCLKEEVSKLGHSLLSGRRFLGSKLAKEAYGVLRSELKKLARTVDVTTELFRARRGGGHSGAALAAPPPSSANAGRGNVRGQPVLYLANDAETAIYEVRPSIGDVVSVGQLRLRRAARICDFTGHEVCTPFVESETEFERYRATGDRNDARWRLGRVLAEPVRAGDEDRDYLPTQFLVRMIADLGFDGVAYASSQRGTNAAVNYLFFDPRSAAPVDDTAEEITVGRIRYEWRRRVVPVNAPENDDD
ncbi:MAG TPA: RES family NAD+ phosphorylase [Polyangia bacterium]|nr:RES family NAD+ phosphorylase [Polyangia bacterium]